MMMMELLEKMFVAEDHGDAMVWVDGSSVDFTVVDFDGFDDDWSEIDHEFVDEELVDEILDWLEEHADYQAGDMYVDYWFGEVKVQVAYTSYDI